MSLQSPYTQITLQLIEGDAGSLLTSAQSLIESGKRMDVSANRLEAISEGTGDLKSDAVDKVREAAGEVFPDLRKAADRYRLTGTALEKYAKKLDNVQNSMNGESTPRGGADWYPSMSSLINAIEEANQTAENKRDAEETAQDSVDDADGGLFGIGEGTDEEKEQAASDLTTATTAREEAESKLNKLWGKFDGRVSYWEDAFDDAVSDIEKAFEIADNQDKWYDHLADALSIAGLVLFVVAIVATGPLALVAAALALVVGIAALGIEIYKMAIGDGDWTSLIIAAVSIIPFGKAGGALFKFAKTPIKSLVNGFGKAKGLPKAIKNLSFKDLKGFAMPFSKAKGIVRNSVGDALPVAYKKPTGSTWNKVKTSFSNSWSEMVHPYRQRQAGREFIEGYQHKFQNRQFTERFTENILVGYKDSRNYVLADYIVENSKIAGPEAIEWATKVRGGRDEALLTGTVDFLGGTFFTVYGTGQTAKNMTV